MVCHQNCLVPSPIPFVTGHSPKIEAAEKAMTDRDLLAVALTIPQMMRVEDVDLSGNALLTERSLVPFLQALHGKPASPSLARLSLKGCLRATHEALQDLGSLGTAVSGTQRANPSVPHAIEHLLSAPGGARKLKHLDLGGLAFGMQSHIAICDAIGGHKALSHVCLSNVDLGFHAATSRCISAVLNCKTLEMLDLSWNRFTADAFSHLGRKVAATPAPLTSLCLTSSASSMDNSCGSPVLFFVERLVESKTLTELDISTNHMDFRGALVLEDALETHKTLREVNVSENPLGVLGIRSMLRLLARNGSSLEHFACNGCSDGAQCLPDPMFSLTNPGGRYRLDLAKPYHRTLLRMLYKTCDRFRIAPEEALKIAASKPAYSHASKGPHGAWEVPTSGSLTVVLNLDKAMDARHHGFDTEDFSGFLRRHFEAVRMQPGFKKEVPMFAQWTLLKGRAHAQAVFLDALSKDFTITLPQIMSLCQTRPMVGDILARLMPCLTDEHVRYMALLQMPTLSGYIRAEKRLRNFLIFNVENPTGHFKLDLGNHSDHAVMERIVLIDRWEEIIGRRQGAFDASQRGNYSHARNELFQDLPLLRTWEIESIAEWNMPESGTVVLDYLCGKRPPADAPCLEETTFTQILLKIQRSKTSNDDELNVLRTVSNMLYVTALQLRSLLDIYSSEAFRIEIFVIFFQRIADIHNEKVCRVRFNNPSELQKLRNRIGFVTYFPFIQPEQCHFELDCAFYDQRVAVSMIKNLGNKERENNIINPVCIQEDGKNTLQLGGIPPFWTDPKNIPPQGIFQCTYKCAPEHRSIQYRNQLLENYGLWKIGVDDSSVKVMWWAALSDAPDDVVEFLEFLVTRYSNLKEPFRVIDGMRRSNKNVTSKEFHEGYEAMGCKKFAGANESARIQNVFRYLDPGGEGSISEGEWQVLISFFNELQLSMREFAQFLARTFGDEGESPEKLLTDAWDYFDDDGSNSITMKEWTAALVNKLCYFGPASQLFNYLDKDDEGTISLSEFMVLAGFIRDREHEWSY